MRRFVVACALAGSLAVPIRSAAAQTSLNYFAQFSPATTVLYIPFYVSVAGTFNLRTSGLALLDPMIRLYSGNANNGPGLGAGLAANDDGAPAQAGWNICTGAGGTCHSMISMFLGTGYHTLAVSVFDLSDAEARAGLAGFGNDAGYGTYCNASGNWATCNYDVAITSADGVAVVPEPVTMALMGTGLLGIGALRRRRAKGQATDPSAE